MIESWNLLVSGLSVERLAELSLAGFAVLAIAGLALAVLSIRASAAQRHAVLNVALCALLVLPALEVILPQWEAGPPIAFISSVEDALVVPLPLNIEEPVPTQRENSSRTGRRPVTRSEIGIREVQLPPVPGVELEEAAGSQEVRVAIPLLSLVVASWLLGSFIILTGLGLNLAARTLHFRKGWTEVTESDWLSAFEHACAQIPTRRTVRLRWGAQARVPVTWGALRPVIVLPLAAKAWGLEQRRAALLHELAHVARGDHASQVLAQIACALHWFNPLAWWAAARLREEAERASDDRAAQALQSPTEYAFELVRVARMLKGRRMRFVSGVAMARSSDLESRIGAILDPDRPRAPVSRRLRLAVVAVALMLTAPLAALSPRFVDGQQNTIDRAQPATAQASSSRIAAGTPDPISVERVIAGIPGVVALESALLQEAPCIPGASGNRSITESISGQNDLIQVFWDTERCKVSFEMEGVHFAGNEQAIETIESGGRFTMKQEGLGPDRELRVRPTANGLEYEYRVDGDVQQYGPEAREWLAVLVPTIFRVTGLQMEERLARFLEQGGPEAVFAEVRMINSDHVAAAYLGGLMSSESLTDDETATLFSVARARIESDHELGKLLRKAWKPQLSVAARREYVEAAKTLSSDHELGQVVKNLFDGPVEGLDAGAVLELARSVESDHELGMILEALQEAVGLAALESELFFEVAGNLESDHELGQVLLRAIGSGEVTARQAVGVLELSRTMQSDHEQGAVLMALIDARAGNLSDPSLLLAAATDLESDHELGRILKQLVTATDLEAGVLLDLLDAADELESDYEHAQLLRRMLDVQWPFTDTVHRRFIESAEALDSDFERDRTLAELARRAAR